MYGYFLMSVLEHLLISDQRKLFIVLFSFWRSIAEHVCMYGLRYFVISGLFVYVPFCSNYCPSALVDVRSMLLFHGPFHLPYHIVSLSY